MSREEEIKKELYENTLSGRAPITEKLTQEGIDLGMNPLEILFQALIPALQEVGRLFEIGEYFVPEMMISAKAMQRAMAILQPILGDTGVEPVGKVLMLTVKGDVHDIGKNLCVIMLEGAGFEVIDMGVNVSPERLLDAVIEHQP
ncbi:MAG: cobalamin-binding protein, partial [Caldilineaceae bacterium SB0670_bin_27]|nr:cobalamin-binding protein [Caldilineaceae bacterium SB0670_bin_27]